MKRNAPGGTQSVIRAVRLLKAFSRERPERSLVELSGAAGLTRTTTHRLLMALESEGLLARTSNKSFRLGPALIALGTEALISHDLRVPVEPELRALAARCGETATLEVPVEGGMLILAEVSGRHLVTAAAELGTRWPMHATSTGKAFLAALPDARRSSWLTPPLKRFTPATVVDVGELDRQLSGVRERGYATANEELETGHSAVAAVLRDSVGTAIGALSVGGPSGRLTPGRLDELGRELVAVASRLKPTLAPRHDPAIVSS